MAEWYYIEFIYYIFFIHSSVNGHLSCFHNLAIVDKSAVNIGVHVDDMYGAREYNAKHSKSVRERQIPNDFTHMWNLRNKADEYMGSRGRKKRREGNKPQEILKDREQTECWWREEGVRWARLVMGIKMGTCCDEHRVLYVSDESVNFTPETSIVLYAN